MRTTVDLDAHLLKRLRAEAQRRGVTFKELLSGVLRRGLEEQPAARPGRYRCPTFAMGAPRMSIDLDKALGMAAGLEDEEIVRELALRR
jgi:hypothetical protein